MDTHKRQLPEDFHGLYDRGYRSSRGALHIGETRVETTTRLASDVPGLIVGHDEATQLPNQIASRKPSARLSLPADSPAEAVTKFIKERRELWNLTPEDVATVKVRSVSKKGLKTVRLFQVVEGKEVFNSDVTVAVTPENE
ncbi:MAG: peptidase, partial [bacterium]|nr:peptidase [bacterium]